MSLACGFTRRGEPRVVEWLTGLARNVEEHPLPPSLVGLERVGDWQALEAFAEEGSWNSPFLQWGLARRLARLPNRRWQGYRVWAAAATKVHRARQEVWGTGTFPADSARCPNRASTVRAPNGVVPGAVLPRVDQPARFLPIAGRLDFRKTQLPAAPQGEPIGVRTKCALLVARARPTANACPGKNWPMCDGAFAVASGVRPLGKPAAADQPRLAVLTRWRHDARLSALPPSERQKGQRGPTPQWGQRIAPPRPGGRGPGGWPSGCAFLYGRHRPVPSKEVLGPWRVLGHAGTVQAVVAAVEGYQKRFTRVSSATDLSGRQIVELFGARFRQEDAFRDLKQQLGGEACRAWTRNPIERTTQALFTAMRALRRLQLELPEERGDDWWRHPPWNPPKRRPRVLDGERLLRPHRAGIVPCLADWLDSEGKAEP